MRPVRRWSWTARVRAEPERRRAASLRRGLRRPPRKPGPVTSLRARTGPGSESGPSNLKFRAECCPAGHRIGQCDGHGHGHGFSDLPGPSQPRRPRPGPAWHQLQFAFDSSRRHHCSWAIRSRVSVFKLCACRPSESVPVRASAQPERRCARPRSRAPGSLSLSRSLSLSLSLSLSPILSLSRSRSPCPPALCKTLPIIHVL